MDALKDLARDYKRSAFANTTQKSYRCQLKCFLQFCLDYNCRPLPVSQDTLVCYVAFLSQRLLPSSLACYLNVLRILHVEAGYPNPLANNYELAMLKRGISRERSVAPKQKHPITLDILVKIHATLSPSSPFDLAFWAACVLGFLGFLRKSTLLPSSPLVPPGKMLTRSDVTHFSYDSFTLVIKNSKVIQFGQKELILPYYRSSNPSLCPIRAVLSHFGASPLSTDRPLFNFSLAGSEVFFSHSMFVKHLKLCLTKARIDHKNFSTHSFRRGGASYAFEIGLPPLLIKQRGDWSSSAYERYVFLSDNTIATTAKALSAGLVRP